jgi:hypothetical protein
LYWGPADFLPPAEDGRYFLNTANGIYDDVLYVNDEPLVLNDEEFTLFTDYDKGIIYVYEDNHWQRKEVDEDYRYLVAMGDYYNVQETLPAVMKNEVANIAKSAVSSNYYGPLIVPPQNPTEGDFFLYIGETSVGPDPEWIKYELYIYKNNSWQRLDESNFQNRNYFMQALQDILNNAPATTGYFSKAFCDAFFANQASLNALSTKIIYLEGDGVIKSVDYAAQDTGLLIDADGNIDANMDTHIAGKVAIGVDLNDSQGNYKQEFSDFDVVIGGNTLINGSGTIGSNISFGGTLNGASGTFQGNLNVVGSANLSGRTVISADAHFTGDIDSGPLYLTSASPTPKTVTYPAYSDFPQVNYSNGIGTYGSYTFDTYTYEIDEQRRKIYARFWRNGVIVHSSERSLDGWVTWYLQYNFVFTYNQTSGSKTLMLRNLPTTPPSAANIVWRDGNTLKIS